MSCGWLDELVCARIATHGSSSALPDRDPGVRSAGSCFSAADRRPKIRRSWCFVMRSRCSDVTSPGPGQTGPDQARPVARDLQGMVPAVMLHGEERSSPEDCNAWLPRNLPGPGRSSPSNPQPCVRTMPLGPAPARCAIETPATRHEAANPSSRPCRSPQCPNSPLMLNAGG